MKFLKNEFYIESLDRFFRNFFSESMDRNKALVGGGGFYMQFIQAMVLGCVKSAKGNCVMLARLAVTKRRKIDSLRVFC